MPSKKEFILSEKYADIILPIYSDFLEEYAEWGAQIFNSYYGMIHYPLEEELYPDFYEYGFFYNTVPKLYTLLDSISLDVSGITSVQTQPVLNLKGANVLLGFIDTGIDYTHPAFRKTDGSSRIYGLWDQTLQEGTPPFDLEYGSAYNNGDLNAALASENPLSVIPSEDTNGHGTFLAGVAGGSTLPQSDFNGAAPESMLAVVKLKEAKQYLKSLFFATGDMPAYQSTDIMMGIRYLTLLAEELEKPLVLCFSLGTNQGPHTGVSPVDSMLAIADNYRGLHSIVAAGNEAGKAHHYYGSFSGDKTSTDVEILVPENSSGFYVEFWSNPPEVFAVGFESPLGETVQKISPRISFSENISFILEDTKIFVSSEMFQTISGNQLIFIRFDNPTPGIWKIRIYTNIQGQGSFHLWLPITGLANPDITFIQPNPDTTLTAPSDSTSVITAAAYNAYNNSLFLNSSRGYTRNGQTKPDFAAPGVNVLGPAPKNQFTTMSGTSVSAAITAGGSALLVEWGMRRTPPRIFNNTELKTLLIRGAKRTPERLYPNREWGYGTLDIYQVLSMLILS